MLDTKVVISSFSVNDLGKAKEFYTQKLGLKLDNEMMALQFSLPGGGKMFVYPKPDHQPASFTVLNFIVDNIDKAVDELTKEGITFEKYEGFDQDEKLIARGRAVGKGPDIAWFKDPFGNILSVIQDK